MGKYLRTSSYIKKLSFIYDFATASLWSSLYTRKIFFSFLSVHKAGHWQWKKLATTDTDIQQPTPDQRQPTHDNQKPTTTTDDRHLTIYNQHSAIDIRQPVVTKNYHRKIRPAINTNTRQRTTNKEYKKKLKKTQETRLEAETHPLDPHPTII